MLALEADEDFLTYMKYHSRTERALFSKDQLERLFRLAGRPCPLLQDAWVSAPYYAIQPLLEEAQARIKDTDMPAKKKNETIELGDEARDTITGFKGIVTSFHKYIHGCARFGLQPRELHEGKPITAQIFDLPQLELMTKANKLKISTTGDTGGPRTEPSRRKVPSRA